MAASGQHRQYIELLEAHGPKVLSMLRRLCKNHHDADDMFQETAVRVWRHFGKRPLLRNPGGWLMTIAYRTFLDHHARQASPTLLVDAPDDRAGSPEAKAQHREECGRLNAAVDRLPAPVRQVVILHYSGGLSLRQTAQAMELSLGTVKSRLNTGLVALRSVLE